MNKTDLSKQLKHIQNTLEHIISDYESGADAGFIGHLIRDQAMALYRCSAEALNKPAEIKPQSNTTSPAPANSQETLPPVMQHPPAPAEVPAVIQNLESPEIQIEIPTAQTPSSPVTVHKTEVPHQEMPKQEVNPVKPVTVGGEEDLTLNERLAKSKTPAINFAEKSKESPIKDLSKAITISKKFEFINGLFNGNAEQYKAFLNTVQNSDSYDAAIAFIEASANMALWEENEKLSSEFYALVGRRFNQ